MNTQKQEILKNYHRISSDVFDLMLFAYRKGFVQDFSPEQIKDFKNYQEFLEEERTKADNPDLYC